MDFLIHVTTSEENVLYKFMQQFITSQQDSKNRLNEDSERDVHRVEEIIIKRRDRKHPQKSEQWQENRPQILAKKKNQKSLY